MFKDVVDPIQGLHTPIFTTIHTQGQLSVASAHNTTVTWEEIRENPLKGHESQIKTVDSWAVSWQPDPSLSLKYGNKKNEC